MSAAGDDPWRFECLEAIGKLLASFEGVERTLPSLLAFVDRVLPLASAVLIEGRRGNPRKLVWHGHSETPERLLRIETKAWISFSMFAGPMPQRSRAMDVVRCSLPLAGRPPDEERAAAPDNFITLPLATERGAVFGALQVEGARRFDEDDLAFVNAVASLLAAAIDRACAWQEQRIAFGTGA